VLRRCVSVVRGGDSVAAMFKHVTCLTSIRSMNVPWHPHRPLLLVSNNLGGASIGSCVTGNVCQIWRGSHAMYC
jgi:hypothetical protein